MLTHITETIKYVGVDVTDKTKFENQYNTPHGMAYNSYIIEGEKIALLDSVDTDATEQWLENVNSALAGRTPDYFIVHHMEPDHSANLSRIMDLYPTMKLVASAKALVMVKQFFEETEYSDRIITVADGDTIDLGDRSLMFFTAPFIHWPEVVMSYDTKDQVLFCADAFGKFGAIEYDENVLSTEPHTSLADIWLPEARRYYCNIVGKYGAQVQQLFKKISAKEVKILAPLHGPMLTGDLTPYINAYQHWSTYTPENDGVLIAYASVYGGTKDAALRMAEALREKGQEVVTIDLCNEDPSEAVAQAFRLSKAVFAAITYDANLFPAMYNFLHHLQMKNWQRRRVALIENGTWAPISGKIMSEMLAKMKDIEIITPTLSLKSTMHKSDAEKFDDIVAEIIRQ